MRYKVIIEETLHKEVAIDAENSNDAVRIAQGLYRNGDIVLSADDFIGEPTIVCQ